MLTGLPPLRLAHQRLISVGVALAVVLGYLWIPPASATSSFKAYRVLGQVDFNSNTGGSVQKPHGLTIDAFGRVLLADTAHNRILIWNSIPSVNNAPPDFVLGQPDLVSTSPNRGGAVGAGTLRCPTGVSVSPDGQKVVAADYGNNRVLIWNSFWNAPSNGAPADIVVGQPSMTAGPAPTADPCGSATASATAGSLAHPGAAVIAASRLLVADTFNSRVLVWFSVPSSNGVPADMVIGQGDFSGSLANAGSDSPTAATLNLPFDVDSDGSRLFVADSINNRVLIWNDLPSVGDGNGPPADLVLGQPNMTTNLANSEFLSHPSKRTMNAPVDISNFGGMLAVSEHYNHRVLLYHQIPTADYASAHDEIGHGRFTSAEWGTSDSRMNHPWGVTISNQGIAVADTENNRVLVFPSPLPVSGNVTAVADSSLGITVSWSAIAGATGYRVYRDGFWFADLAASQVSFTDTKLSPDTYLYSVSPLSDQNRVEGASMGAASATASGILPGLVVTRHSSYRFYLAEGDSVVSEDSAYAHRPEHMYPQQIATYLPVPYFNGARSGSTCISLGSQSILEPDRLPQEIATYNPDLVTIGIGLNDSTQGYDGTHGAYSMAEYRDCMNRVIQTVQPSASRTLLLMNFHHMTNWKMNDPKLMSEAPDTSNSSGSEQKKRAWNKIIRDVAAHAGVPVVDVTSAMDAALAANPSESYLLPSDKVHPDQAGQDVIAEAAVDQLLNFLPVSGGPAHPGRPTTPSETVVTEATSQAVDFSWTPTTGEIRAENGYELRWSQDATFNSGVESAYVSGTSATLDLTNGKWYVKVRGISPSGVPGPWSLSGRVRITAEPIGDPPPSATSPTQPGRPSAMYSGKDVHELSRRWIRITWKASQDPDGITHSEVRWCRKEGTQEVGYNLGYQCGEGIAWGPADYYDMMEVLPAGVWEMEVRSVDKTGEKSPWSEKGTWVSVMLY